MESDTHEIQCDQGPIYIEYQRQYCDVASDVDLIKLLWFLNKPSELLEKIGCNTNWSDMTQPVMLRF